jgi:hypothetical protein
MRTLVSAVAVVCVFLSAACAQQPSSQPKAKQYQVTLTENVNVSDRVVLSSESSTVRVADLNETMAINGRLMRVGDLMAVLSSDSLLAPRPRTPENQTPAASQPTQPPSKKY